MTYRAADELADLRHEVATQTRWCRAEQGHADLTMVELLRFLVAADRHVRRTAAAAKRAGIPGPAFSVEQALVDLAELVRQRRQPKLPGVDAPPHRELVE